MNSQDDDNNAMPTPEALHQLAVATVSLTAIGTVVFRWSEDGWSWVDSFYFSVVAVTTVGIGDFAPTTDAPKLFAVFYFLSGFSIIATFLDARFMRRAQHLND